MLNVVFAVEGSDVRAAKSTAACMTQEIQPPKVVDLTERVLIWAGLRMREELGCDEFAAFLCKKSVSSRYGVSRKGDLRGK